MKCQIILRAKCCLRLTPLLFLLFSWMKAQIYPFSHSYLSMSDMLQIKGLMNNFCSVAFIPHSSSLAVKRKHALSYFRTKRRSQVVFSCKTKTRSFLGIWWRRIFYLAYLADIFEALNQLNKKLQGPGTNIL